MEQLLQQLMGQFGPSTIDSLSKQIGADPKQTQDAVSGAIPSILGAMSNNSKSSSGANGLLGALDRDHDGSILDDIGGFIGKGDTSQGSGILKHVLGGQENDVADKLSAKSGLQKSQMNNVMQMVAPIIMGYLGKQKRQSSSGLNSGNISGLLSQMTSDADNSTGIDLNDVLSMVGGLTGSKGRSSGLGGLLGKFFSK